MTVTKHEREVRIGFGATYSENMLAINSKLILLYGNLVRVSRDTVRPGDAEMDVSWLPSNPKHISLTMLGSRMCFLVGDRRLN
jgi:hypothetical protein